MDRWGIKRVMNVGKGFGKSRDISKYSYGILIRLVWCLDRIYFKKFKIELKRKLKIILEGFEFYNGNLLKVFE